MPTLIKKPQVVEAEGNLSMMVQEYVGRVNSGTSSVSIARVMSPEGRVETGKTPEYDEYSLVLMGTLRIESRDRTFDVCSGQAVIVPKGKWVRYSTPELTEYIAVCLPAFAPRMMRRDME
jgi:mannose-6-phosphate isomerase-like protein (cupin superfamily)